VKKVYGSQGQDINDKHIEVVVKQLFSKVFIEDSGNSSFIPGIYVKYEEFIKVNKELEAAGKKAAKGKRLALGLTNIAKETDSWLSAASFQETIRVMVASSLKGSIDKLSDLKSNVIIGRLLPFDNYFIMASDGLFFPKQEYDIIGLFLKNSAASSKVRSKISAIFFSLY
jgi:DNA-directed RNA polymerase subunit beta'